MLGFNKDEVVGKTDVELGILSRETINAILLKADSAGNVTNAEAELKAKNGDIKQVLLSSENVFVQDKKFRFTVVNDITERKLAEEEIKHNAGLISSQLDSIPDIIFYKDVNGVYLGCNPPFAEFVGWSRDEIIGKTDYDLFTKEIADFFRKHDKLMLDLQKPRQNEEWITYPDGREILIDTLKTPYWGPDGTLIGLLGISRDITERKKAETEIKLKNEHLEKINAEKDKFFSIIAHDLRSPFTGFLGLTKIMAEGLQSMTLEEIQEIAVNMKNSANKLYSLLGNCWLYYKNG